MRRRLPIRIAGAAALGASMVPAASVEAAVSCGYNPGPSLRVTGITLTAPGDSATLAVEAGEITVNGAHCASNQLGGEVATTSNTDFIVTQDTSGAATEVRIADPAAFAPGFSGEDDGSAEIEFGINLGDGDGDVLRLEAAGPDVEDHFDLGLVPGPAGGANLNARAEEGANEDVDLGVAGVELVAGDGRGLDDTIDAEGAAPPFLGPFPVEIEAFGLDGSDTLRGGALVDLVHGGVGDDLLAGGDGRDVLLGQADEDVLAGGSGPDRLDGGPDDDVADYRVVPRATRRGIEARLGGGTVAGAGEGDRLLSIEGVLGTPLDDFVTGDAGRNFIEGGGGHDVLAGLGESDALLGSTGRDILIGGGARDVIVDGPGVDGIFGENGKDVVALGPGDDTVGTGKGRDLVDAAGGGVDVVNCGPGRDGFDADRRDRVRACEVRIEIDGRRRVRP